MKNSIQKRQFKRQMRRNPTAAEKVFKARLVALGVDFKHQMILGWYIPDFVLPDYMIVFELDGESHKGREWYDSSRDEFIRKCGFEVIRIPNKDAETFPLEFLQNAPKHLLSKFRSGLGRANSRMGIELSKKMYLTAMMAISK